MIVTDHTPPGGFGCTVATDVVVDYLGRHEYSVKRQHKNLL